MKPHLPTIDVLLMLGGALLALSALERRLVALFRLAQVELRVRCEGLSLLGVLSRDEPDLRITLTLFGEPAALKLVKVRVEPCPTLLEGLAVRLALPLFRERSGKVKVQTVSAEGRAEKLFEAEIRHSFHPAVFLFVMPAISEPTRYRFLWNKTVVGTLAVGPRPVCSQTRGVAITSQGTLAEPFS